MRYFHIKIQNLNQPHTDRRCHIVAYADLREVREKTNSQEVAHHPLFCSRLLSFLICCIGRPNHCYLQLNVCLKHQDLQIFVLKLNKYEDF